jgi:predicted nucleic acid-binding protein
MYVLDSFAWLELFEGTKKGAKVKEIIKNNEGKIYTTIANYYEVYYRIEQKLGKEKRKEAIDFIENCANIININKDIASIAAQIRMKEKMSAIDTFTLAAARLIKAKVVTGDKDFQNIPEAILI